MEEYRIELLIKIQERNTVLNNEEKIVKLFNLNDKLEIQAVGNKKYHELKYKGKRFRFVISMESENIYSVVVYTVGKLENESERTDALDILTEVVRELKITISANLKNCSYEVLWDDVGIYYAELAFPKIIQIENLMRKLITKFMLVSVGMDFFNNIPTDLNLRDDKNADSGFLHNIDFIDLKKYLFVARSLKKQDELLKIIDSLEENTLPPDVDLLNYKRDSYWNRYFREKIGSGIDADSIKDDWEKLYKLRCRVAHSKFLKKDEYLEIDKICRKLSGTFSDALDKLNDISLSEENKEIISDDIFTEIEGKVWHEKLYELIIRNFDDEFTLNDLYGFEPLLKEQYPENNTIQASIRRNLQKLRDDGKIIFISQGKYRIVKENESAGDSPELNK